MSFEIPSGAGSYSEGLRTGTHPPYRWLTSEAQYSGTLVTVCPEVLLGRRLAVTGIDGGDPWLTDRQKSACWQHRSGIVYSPRLSTTDELFYQRDGLDCPGYDEWYLLDTNDADLGVLIGRSENPFEAGHEPRPGRLMVFVNFAAFVLHDPTEQYIPDLFWKQLEWVEPESYLADGREFLTFVTRNDPLFEMVYDRLKAVYPSG